MPTPSVPQPAVIEHNGMELASMAFTAWLYDVDQAILVAEIEYQRTQPALEGVIQTFSLPGEWVAAGRAKMKRLGIRTSAQAEALFARGVER